jgi:hypothetical protein
MEFRKPGGGRDGTMRLAGRGGDGTLCVMTRALRTFPSATIPLLATLLLPTAAVHGAAPVPTPAQFEKIQSLVKPAEEAKWEQIPWMASLWQARIKAAKEGKPILLWEMDGHPLGCV